MITSFKSGQSAVAVVVLGCPTQPFRKYFRLQEEEMQENRLPVVPYIKDLVKIESSSKCKSKY